MEATSGGDRRLRQLDSVSDVSTNKLDVSESASDAEPVRFFRHDNALPNEPSYKARRPRNTSSDKVQMQTEIHEQHCGLCLLYPQGPHYLTIMKPPLNLLLKMAEWQEASVNAFV